MVLRGLFLALAGASVMASAPGAAADTPLIVAFGDSLTSGHGIGRDRAYPAALQRRLDDVGLDLKVVNAGVSGDTSSRAVRRLANALDGNVRVFIVAFGANDGLRGTPVSQLKANLGFIIEAAQAKGIAVLLCGMEALPLFGWDYSVAFHRAFREVAERYHVPLVPFMLAGVIGNPEMMQRDRVHPNAEGARAIADNIWPYLKPLAEDAVAAR